MGQRAAAGTELLKRTKVTLRDLPAVEVVHQYGAEYAVVGEWTLDPREEPDPLEAWDNAKAWAAYALWLEAK